VLILQKGKICGAVMKIFAFGNATADFDAGHVDTKILLMSGQKVRGGINTSTFLQKSGQVGTKIQTF